jgi:hypothetical protein
MKKFLLPVSILFLAVAFFTFSSFNSKENRKTITVAIANKTITKGNDGADNASIEKDANELYETLGLSKLGMSREALRYAYKGVQVLERKGILHNTNILTVCDFSQPSSNKRMYIIDLANKEVLLNTYVAHGRNSGLQYAEHFSNADRSLESSLGFYVTKSTYYGGHGLSLRLAGLEPGFNSNAESRAIVVHGAIYIGASRLGSPYMGRSWGCPAVPQEMAPKVINLIKNGTCMFIYHPSQKYLETSRIING